MKIKLRSFSLTSRLTIYFTLVVAVVTLGLSALFIAMSDSHFLELDSYSLRDKRSLVENAIANADSLSNAAAQIVASGAHKFYAAIADERGETLFCAEGFDPPQSIFEENGDEVRIWREGDREFRAVVFSAKGSFYPEKLKAIAAIDTEHHAEFMRDLRETIIQYALIAVVISGALGYFAAKGGLAPLRAMKAKAGSISANRLDAQMPVESVPIEMADLAGALNQMLERLRDDFERLTDFSSDLAHELRTPISNLLTQTQVALSAKRDGETYREILSSNAEEFERLGRMVSDMLFLAKTERGVDLPRKERFFAAEETRALLEFYEIAAEEKEAKLTLMGDAAIDGDRLMFRRAVSNLLSNALRYVDRGGAISVTIERLSDKATIAVENGGETIDPKALLRIFDRFYGADKSRANGGDGAGLGLAIVKAIAKAHNGDVFVSSEQGITR
ncbi:MAG: heavy metal sensor histidine kinase, partial [Helicobacteraceae bacterium]|nr:heavy metal sensor histidine kinase [Helicobacteraceae bacterium]